MLLWEALDCAGRYTHQRCAALVFCGATVLLWSELWSIPCYWLVRGFNKARTTGSVGHIRGAYRKYTCSPSYQQRLSFNVLHTRKLWRFRYLYSMGSSLLIYIMSRPAKDMLWTQQAKYSSSWALCTAYGNRITMHTSWSLSRSGYIIILGDPHNYPGRHNNKGSGCRSTWKYSLKDLGSTVPDHWYCNERSDSI